MNKRLAGIVLAAALLGGCAPPAIVFLNPHYSAAKVKKVALVDFEDYPGVAGSGDITAGIFEKYLLLGGYTFIDRNQVVAVMREQNLQVSDNSDSETLSKLGKYLGVDALAFGQVNDYTDSQDQTVTENVPMEQSEPVYGKVVMEQTNGNTQVKTVQDVAVGYDTVEGEQSVQETETTPARVAISVRLVDIQGGEVLWSASAAGHGLHLDSAAEQASTNLMDTVKDQTKDHP
jgi:hypothetical protein